MKFSNASSGVGTAGLTGIVLMVMHMTDHLTGWAWPILYILMILAGMSQENRK
jgi:hypothetical protein